MGHRFSKSSVISVTGNTHSKRSSSSSNRSSLNCTNQSISRISHSAPQTPTNLIPISPVINVQFEDENNQNIQASSLSSSSYSTLSTSGGARQIIIKIKLAKMENGQDEQQQQQAQAPDLLAGNLNDYYSTTDANSNQTTTATATTNTEEWHKTAGSSAAVAAAGAAALNANYKRGTTPVNRVAPTTANISDPNSSESVEYCEVLEPCAASTSRAFKKHNNVTRNSISTSAVEHRDRADADRCRQKKRSSFPSFRRMLEGSSKSHRSRERQTQQNHLNNNNNNKNEQHSRSSQTYAVPPQPQPLPQPCCSHTAATQTQTASEAIAAVAPTSAASSPQSLAVAVAAASTSQAATANTPNQLAIRTQNNTDVVIPLNTPQFVFVCPTSALLAVGRFAGLMTTEMSDSGAQLAMHSNLTQQPPRIVHSQVDFVHCLVPDLERIYNSSFYWGKMDRYEAERLLEGKPEGTFLLRDSAQEEFLFSVTFRKYERSLHARIEQSGHKFSFDCHDPGVFTAPTVTGLLEHYKDPSCVMFFEPMLTIPFHRKTPFSLQQLARSTIVSHTTYDGISELELPMRLKAYLKEYHYKKKLRVKPCDETFFYCT